MGCADARARVKLQTMSKMFTICKTFTPYLVNPDINCFNGFQDRVGAGRNSLTHVPPS